MSKILDEWEELKLHFSLTDVLHSMHSDPQNLLYLTYLKSIISEVQCAKAFEGEQSDGLSKLLDCLMWVIKSVCCKVINPMAKMYVLKEPIDGHISPKPYLGYIFEAKAAQLKLSPEAEDCVRRRCVNYTISLAN